MKCLLLATGEERSLLPLTEYVPSPMLPIVDQPVMSYAVELLARSELSEICVSLYHQADEIEDYFGDGQRWNVRLNYLLQHKSWGTAGAIKRAYRRAKEALLVLPADIVIDLDIQAAAAFHQMHSGSVTMILNRTSPDPHHQAKSVQLDRNGCIRRIESASPTNTDPFFTGAYILDPNILNYIPDDEPYDCHSQLIPKLIEAGEAVYGYTMDGYWNPLDTFHEYQAAQIVFLNSLTAEPFNYRQPLVRYPYIEARMSAPGIWCGKNTFIHPSARLIPPVYVGSGCRIGRDVELGPGAIINANTIIDTGTTIQDSTILNNTYVGQYADIKHRIIKQTKLIDIQSEANVEISDHFLLAFAGPAVAYSTLRRTLERSVALILLICFLPLLILTGLATWVTSGRAIFCQVQRVGMAPTRWRTQTQRHLKAINLWHFRTHAPNGSSTTLGRWLRRWEIDRLPSLWNVVQDDLALIGVKPLSEADAELISEEWQQKRYDCPMGFTGLWYTRTKVSSDFEEICVMDTYQAAVHTWRQDLILLLVTPIAWIKRLRTPRSGINLLPDSSNGNLITIIQENNVEGQKYESAS